MVVEDSNQVPTLHIRKQSEVDEHSLPVVDVADLREAARSILHTAPSQHSQVSDSTPAVVVVAAMGSEGPVVVNSQSKDAVVYPLTALEKVRALESKVLTSRLAVGTSLKIAGRVASQHSDLDVLVGVSCTVSSALVGYGEDFLDCHTKSIVEERSKTDLLAD